MRTALPPLDLHAHIDTAVPEDDLRELGAVVFVATRSLAEAQQAVRRQDETIIWGVGCHPGLARSHRNFDPATFASLIEQSAFVSEFGLDGGSRIGLDRQLRTLRCALDVLVEQPRITSLHSHRATDLLLDELGDRSTRGIVLHWWMGGVKATERAVGLGCYFSVNAAMLRHPAILDQIPRDRLLTETDHPFGDRSSPQPRRPGAVLSVEHVMAREFGESPEAVRRLVWNNLGRLVTETGCAWLLSRRVRSYLIVGSLA
jgi:TatD DNase family protein